MLIAARPHTRLLPSRPQANVFRSLTLLLRSQSRVLESWRSVIDTLTTLCSRVRTTLARNGREVPTEIAEFLTRPTSSDVLPSSSDFDDIALEWQALIVAIATALHIRQAPHVEAAGVYVHYVKTLLGAPSNHSALTTKMFVSPDVMWSFVVRAQSVTFL